MLLLAFCHQRSGPSWPQNPLLCRRQYHRILKESFLKLPEGEKGLLTMLGLRGCVTGCQFGASLMRQPATGSKGGVLMVD